MSAMILKVQYKDELRRVAIDADLTMAALTERVRCMFPQLPEHFGFRCADFQIVSEEDLQTAISLSQNQIPPLLRLVVTEPQPQPVSPPSPFIPVEMLKLSESLPLFASCAACRRPLGTVYFKCLNCLHYELCTDCENHPCNHDDTHLLVKLRMPVDQLPLKQQLIFKSHILDRAERVMAREAKRQLRAQKSGLCAKKKEERRRERAQKKLRRMEQKLESRKNKTEAKKKLRQQKVKKVKKVVPQAQAAVVEPIVSPATVAETSTTASAFFEIPAARPTLPAVSSCPTSPAITEKKEEFNIFRLMAEFQLLKEDKKKHEQSVAQKEQEAEVKVEDVKEEAREEIAAVSVEEPTTETESEVAVVNSADAVEPAQLETSTESSPFQRNLQTLEDMGFTDRNHNIELLVRNVGNLETTVDQLLRESAPGILKWLPFNLPL